MKEWYCYVGGRRYGPIGEDVLRQWAAEGRLRPTDQVWTEGMAEWAPAGTVEGIFPPGAVGPPSFNRLLSCPPPGGTRGQTPNSELTSQARQLLRGNWGLPIGFSLLLVLLLIAPVLVPYVGPVAILIVAGAFELGGVVFYITFVRRGDCQLGMLFAGFKVFGKALGACLLRALLIVLWVVPGYALMIAGAVAGGAAEVSGDDAAAGLVAGLVMLGVVLLIPGIVVAIIMALSYSQMFFLIADDQSLGPLTALRRSKEMMRGYKGKLFCLWLRFFCWWLLCVLAGIPTCGIGMLVGTLFLTPYISVSYARFYDDLREPAAAGSVQQLSGSAPMAGPQA